MRALISRELPIFASFFLTSVGNGGNQIARPLFSASFGVSLFFVALINITSPIASLVGGPLAGILADRLGRRPVIMVGLAIRALSSFLEFFADSYVQFLALELIGSFGLAIWMTGGTIIIADISGAGSFGRAVGLRTSSQRLGLLIGPLIAGWLGVTFGLRSIFLLNAAGKLAALFIYLLLIRESRPDAAGQGSERPSRILPRRADLAEFMTAPVLVVLIAVIASQIMAGTGAFEVLFPIHVRNAAGFTTEDIGYMLTITGLATFLVALPNGVIVDRFGRKASMLPGMAVLALGCYLLAGASDYWHVVVAVIVLGIGNGACLGAAQVLAMDLGAGRAAWHLPGGLAIHVEPGRHRGAAGRGQLGAVCRYRGRLSRCRCRSAARHPTDGLLQPRDPEDC